MPNGSMDDVPCRDQLPQYRACESFKPRRTCKACMFFQEPHRRVKAAGALPCDQEPRQATDPVCPHFRKAERPARAAYGTA